MSDVSAAVTAINRGELVVYPTETVYGLGADALVSEAVERVFCAKDRPWSDPISFAVASVEEALPYISPSERTIAFMEEFLPGPVTVVTARGPQIPDVLTAGSNRVGVRVPDHDLAHELLEQTGPITATSANQSGSGSVTQIADLDDRIREHTSVIIDDGQTPGTGSTVVDVDAGEIHRRGHQAAAIERWLEL